MTFKMNIRVRDFSFFIIFKLEQPRLDVTGVNWWRWLELGVGETPPRGSASRSQTLTRGSVTPCSVCVCVWPVPVSPKELRGEEVNHMSIFSQTPEKQPSPLLHGLQGFGRSGGRKTGEGGGRLGGGGSERGGEGAGLSHHCWMEADVKGHA